ncbi:MAG: class I SAM-dependent methyltransferase [Chloroflexi bacterium]|nr:class I SAM-dependent methyltransferase [Chloroflexota bacterium]
MVDEIARYNKGRWEELAEANIEYSRPFLDLNPEKAREVIDPEGILTDVSGLDVLCLASGGGQQSAAFGLLGANVAVFDLSETQLERDREAAEHYSLDIQTVQGDMRDLSHFEDDSFDIVWNGHSLGFVPNPPDVFSEVARVVRPGGLYRLTYQNPFLYGMDKESWDGESYHLPGDSKYADSEVVSADPRWSVEGTDGVIRYVVGPREFRHKLSTVINGLIGWSS